ncbi:MAG: hypothetical protein LC648_05130 [Novosphingobium sp.]|nr:hypothetical protein [Novosphingobium sp.]
MSFLTRRDRRGGKRAPPADFAAPPRQPGSHSLDRPIDPPRKSGERSKLDARARFHAGRLKVARRFPFAPAPALAVGRRRRGIGVELCGDRRRGAAPELGRLPPRPRPSGARRAGGA